ncbi:MAG: carboxypeptidase regulatory-like domain-containing protein [Candidatus Sericytochromatia bacterium]|nr:carboxypeptidase regulatory-like domain-containing protein [Candidatus Sericytochromatia bacterium]
MMKLAARSHSLLYAACGRFLGALLPLAILGCSASGTNDTAPVLASVDVSKAARPVLTGRVLDASGKAVVDVLVEAFGHTIDKAPVTLPNGQTALIFLDAYGLGSMPVNRTLQAVVPPSTKTGADGRFSLQLPSSGAYNVEAVLSADQKAWKSKVDAGQATVAVGDMALAATSVLTGRLTMPVTAGSPEGAEVYLAGSVYKTTTDASGSYRFENVPAGTVDIVAYKADRRGKAVCVSVAPDAEVQAPDAPMEVYR